MSKSGRAICGAFEAAPGAPTTINAYQTAVFVADDSFIVSGDQPFAVTAFLLSNEEVTVDPTPTTTATT